MSLLLIVYLVGCAISFIIAVLCVAMEYTEDDEDVCVSHIVLIVLSTASSFVYIAACFLCDDDVLNKIIIKHK